MIRDIVNAKKTERSYYRISSFYTYSSYQYLCSSVLPGIEVLVKHVTVLKPINTFLDALILSTWSCGCARYLNFFITLDLFTGLNFLITGNASIPSQLPFSQSMNL